MVPWSCGNGTSGIMFFVVETRHWRVSTGVVGLGDNPISYLNCSKAFKFSNPNSLAIIVMVFVLKSF